MSLNVKIKELNNTQTNIAGKLSQISRDSSVDVQSQNGSKKDTKKNYSLH